MPFTPFNLRAEIMKQIEEEGYTNPTPIQSQAIPAVLAGQDVMGLAQTGTGKTAAFVLPILQKLIPGPRGKLRALIIAPTRELAEQINETIRSLGKTSGLTSLTIYGGVGLRGQISALKRGVDIVVACPGRLLDHLQQHTISLTQIEILVLDEADQMFDMGFLPNIRKIIKHIPTKRQTLLFSATMPPDIRRLTEAILKNPVTIEVAHTKPVEAITHAIFPVKAHLKTDLLLALLKQTETQSVLIFTKTKHRAKSVDKLLKKEGYRCASLQGNLSQGQRQAALNGFRDGRFDIMVATDIAARGIDVSRVSHVINFDLPDTTEAYIHRTGRTGRASRTGDAYSIVADTTDDATMIKQIERKMGGPLERLTIEGFNYNLAASTIPKAAFARTHQPQQRKKTWGSSSSAPITKRKR
ncbi:MAG: DEAD/DEAH box helicase [Candidatus Margulisbacteria bacterium]|nr:DEAD/DEAH box helicase [Candidatus Margulisiibacteriota bacterium]